MEWWTTLAILFGALAFGLAIGLPVAFTFIAVNIAGLFVFMGGMSALSLLAGNAFSALTTFVLISIPLFILMGEILLRSGLASITIDAADKWIGRIPGRLSVLAVGSGTLFGALSGSSIASVAMLGSSLAPEMQRHGYRSPMIIGSIVASGGLAVLIPPSSLAVLLGAVAEVSIAKLLIAGIVPGLLLGGCYVAYFVIRAKLNPEIAPVYDAPRASMSDKLLAMVTVVPLLLIVLVVTGFIFLGIATPSESAALGAVATAFLALAYRRLNFKVLSEAAMSTMRSTAMILMIIVGSIAYSQVLAGSGATSGLVDFISKVDLPPIVLVLLMQLIVLILGCFIDPVSIMLLTVPIFLPIITALGLDPIWFCVLILVQLELSGITPPFGVLLFVLRGVQPSLGMGEIYRAALPIVAIQVLLIVFILLVPEVALWLPSLIGN